MGGRGGAGGGKGLLAGLSGDSLKVAKAVIDLQPSGGYASLADVRDKLAGMTHAAQDAALKQLNRRPGVVIVPENNQTKLTPRDRKAALMLGGQPQHLIKIIKPSR